MRSGDFKKGNIPWNKGKKTGIKPPTIFKSEDLIGEKHWNWKGGMPKCLECGKLLSAKKAIYCKKHYGALLVQEKHPLWKGGISIHVHSTKEPRYKEWRMKVFTRDSFKCKICNTKEKLQAHHILRWADYPELRYDINNGITLCVAHHPRKKAEEKRLAPTFVELVSVSSDSN